ncbi:MAG: exodeoxyribonuclease VII small subunit [Ruminiclostridium sp.]|nr:exodeoxyribonuclease VII small subunit [Ruminiclostridium sp.]
MSFETAMKRLDEISAEMEKPDITLDNSMKFYKEAVELVDFCRKYIADAKLTVQNFDEI